MDPLKYVKKIFIAAMPGQYATDYTTIRSIAHVIGFDGVYAMNKVQRNIYIQAHPHAQQRLEFFSSRLDEQWTKVATVEEEGLDAQERSYVEKRKEFVRAKLSSLLNEELCEDDIPCISLCSSGGGVRAMIFTLGCLLAASELGILDCCIYSASLSGSAWLQACWMNMKGSCAESLKSLRQWLGLCLQRHPILQAALAEGGQDAVLMERDVKLEFDVQTRKEYMKLRAKLLTSASSFGGSENQPPIAAGAGEEEAMEEDENGGTILLSNLGIETFKMDSSSLFWSDEHVRGVAQLFGDASLHVNNSIMQAQSTIHSLKLRQESRDAFEEEVKQWTAWSSRLRGGKRSANSRMEGMRGVGDLSFVEMYGLLAANAWLPPCPKDRLWRMERGLSSQIESLQLHDRPFPLYVAVGIDHKKVDGEESNEYHWYEFSPFSFSSSQTGKRIPIWSLGRSFHSGRSCSVTPEFPLGVCMGIWGAAFTASTEEVKKNYRNTSSRAQSRRDVVQIIHDTFNILDSNSSDQAIDEVSQVKTSSRAGSIRVVEPFQCFNPFFEDPSHLEEDPCTDAETSDLRLTDAGIHMNAPLPALLRRERASDVIILLDSRSTSGEADVNDSFDVLKPAEEYAKQRDLPFPSIRDQDLIEIGRRRCTVLGFEEDSAPEIVYMPLVKNEEVDEDLDPLHTPWCDFMEFAYEPEHFERLFQLAYQNFRASESCILQVFRRAVDKKRAPALARGRSPRLVESRAHNL
uniref:PLA2c domain-containing protein n=2 Tax=Guillardia theta TaxID=55529 RepID=A0A7S4K5Q6_GUITH